MTIKEVEEQTGLSRSNIRFYEKEKLIEPLRNHKNGYRDYSQADVENIKKIAYLRTLQVSVEDLRRIIKGQVSLLEIIEKQTTIMQDQLEGLHKAKALCRRMLEDGDISFEELQVEKYVTEMETYWNDHETVFQLDSVRFLHIWGSLTIWILITSLCLMTGILSYAKLPMEIPVQWNGQTAVSFVSKNCIFAYPVACILIRILLRPIISAKIPRGCFYRELITEYLSNYLCFIALSVELFSILSVQGLVKNIVTILFMDTIVLLGILIAGIMKIRCKNL